MRLPSLQDLRLFVLAATVLQLIHSVSCGSSSSISHNSTTDTAAVSAHVHTDTLFSSPIGIFQTDDTWFHESLRMQYLTLYEQYKVEEGATANDDPTTLNHNFFTRQQEAHTARTMTCERLRKKKDKTRSHTTMKRSDLLYQKLICSDTYRAMMGAAYASVTRYMEVFDMPGVVLPEDFPENVFSWGSLHHGHSQHMTHTHHGSSVSVVYYLSIPQESGVIGFMDPRGPRWPFGGILEHKPSDGDVVVFPGWIPHYVQSSGANESNPRISIAFNLGESWKEISQWTLRN
jgi:hypothetical protein